MQVQDFDSKIQQYGKLTKRNGLPKLVLNKHTDCGNHVYPFCGKKVSIHYPVMNFAMREQGKVTVRCMICNANAQVRLSQYRRDKANNK